MIDDYNIELDNLKTKVLKYVLYKKRTENEVRNKFSSPEIDKNMLDDVIEILKQNGYINDIDYVKRAIDEFLAINILSVKEIKNKLYSKGIDKDIIDEYIYKYEEELSQYELTCAKKIIYKKQIQMTREEIEKFLYKKGYNPEIIKKAYD